MRSSSRTQTGAPIEVVRQVYAIVELAGQVHSWLAMGEVRSWLAMGVVRSWMQSGNVHHCRALSTLEWVCRAARHVLLSKMVPCTGDAVVLGRVELPCTFFLSSHL